MSGKTKPLIFASLLLLVTNPVYAEVYKWVDEDGNVIYGDKPVSKDKADKVEIKKAPKQDASIKERQKKQQKLLNVLQDERDEKIAAEEEEQKRIAEQEQECTRVRKELNEMKRASFLYEETDDPNNPKIISDEEREAEQERYENFLNENC